ncbi:MAG TPA: hypothetical protein VKC63_08605 [Solirubrobacterales bacterium]|nr:hypothetical protein [Solirubrobacterales bacterium]
MPSIHPNASVDSDSIGSRVTISEFAVVRPGAEIGDGVTIHPHVVIAENVRVGSGTEVLPGSFLGRAPRAAGAIARTPDFEAKLTVGPDCAVGANVVVYYDVEIGADNLIGDGASIRELSRIGEGNVIGRDVTLDREVTVGNRTRIMDKSHLTGGMRIGDDVFIAAMVVSTNDNSFGGDGYIEEVVKGPVVEDGAMIGGAASLLPGVVVGRSAIVGSGAVVTKDVANGVTVMGVPARPVDRQ